MKKFRALMSILVVVMMLLSACATPEPEIITKTVEVETIVKETVETTVIVEKPVEIETIVTATPLPASCSTVTEVSRLTFRSITGVRQRGRPTATLRPVLSRRIIQWSIREQVQAMRW